MKKPLIMGFALFFLIGIRPSIAQTLEEQIKKEEIGQTKPFQGAVYPARVTPFGLNLPQPYSNNVSPRVIGGTNANEKYWDNVVFLELHDATSGKVFICGGSMLTPRWVMTAAHCVTRSNGTVYPAGDIFVLSEFNNSSFTDVWWGQNVYRHPNYNSVTIENDIALIKLPGDLGGVSKKTYLWNASNSDFDTANNRAKVLGWGITASGNISSKLQQATTNIISNNACSAVFNGIYDSSLCVQNPQSNPTSCNGDSGGPLFITNDADDALQVGVVSWGVNGCSIPGYPSVYARVSSFIPWIDGIIGEGVLDHASDIVDFYGDDILFLITPLL